MRRRIGHVSYQQANLSELHFIGLDGNERWYKLSADGASVIYHHAASDDVIYTAPQGAALTMRFWVPAGANYSKIAVGIDVAISQSLFGKSASGSASSMLNIRNHPV